MSRKPKAKVQAPVKKEPEEKQYIVRNIAMMPEFQPYQDIIFAIFDPEDKATCSEVRIAVKKHITRTIRN